MTMQQAAPEVLVSTTSEIPGYEIVQYVGIAMGATVRTRSVFGESCANCQSACGGEVTVYTQVVIEARNEAIYRMILNAQQMGANAVIGVRIDTDIIGQGASGNMATIAYGTAVIIKPLKMI